MCKAMYVFKKHDVCPPVNMTLEGVDWFFHWYLFFWQNAHVSLISAFFFFLPYSVCRPTVHVVLALPLYIQTLVWTSCFLLLFTEDNIVVVNKKKTKLSLSSSFTYMFVLCSYFHIQGVLNLRWNTISTVWSSSIFGAIRTYMLYVFFFLANFTVMEMAFPLKSLTYVWDDVINWGLLYSDIKPTIIITSKFTRLRMTIVTVCCAVSVCGSEPLKFCSYRQ